MLNHNYTQVAFDLKNSIGRETKSFKNFCFTSISWSICLHFESILVRFLHDGQLWVRRFRRQRSVRRIFGSVEHERPFLEPTALRILRVEADLQKPFALRVLAPGVRCHEWPFGESIALVVVVRSLAQNHWSVKRNSFWTKENQILMKLQTSFPSVMLRRFPDLRGGSSLWWSRLAHVPDSSLRYRCRDKRSCRS